jgi:hypothetical protein
MQQTFGSRTLICSVGPPWTSFFGNGFRVLHGLDLMPRFPERFRVVAHGIVHRGSVAARRLAADRFRPAVARDFDMFAATHR